MDKERQLNVQLLTLQTVVQLFETSHESVQFILCECVGVKIGDIRAGVRSIELYRNNLL